MLHALGNFTEVYRDRFRGDAKYYLVKLDSYYLCIIVEGNAVVVTAHLINHESMRKRLKDGLGDCCEGGIITGSGFEEDYRGY